MPQQMTTEQRREQAIRQHTKLPESVLRKARLANWDLYNGPGGLDWPEGYSFQDYAQAFREACDDIGTLYYCPDWEGITTTEPEGETVWTCKETGEEHYEEPEDVDDGDEDGNDLYDISYNEPEEYYAIEGSDIAEAYGFGKLYPYG